MVKRAYTVLAQEQAIDVYLRDLLKYNPDQVPSVGTASDADREDVSVVSLDSEAIVQLIVPANEALSGFELSLIETPRDIVDVPDEMTEVLEQLTQPDPDTPLHEADGPEAEFGADPFAQSFMEEINGPLFDKNGQKATVIADHEPALPISDREPHTLLLEEDEPETDVETEPFAKSFLAAFNETYDEPLDTDSDAASAGALDLELEPVPTNDLKHGPLDEPDASIDELDPEVAALFTAPSSRPSPQEVMPLPLDTIGDLKDDGAQSFEPMDAKLIAETSWESESPDLEEQSDVEIQADVELDPEVEALFATPKPATVTQDTKPQSRQTDPQSTHAGPKPSKTAIQAYPMASSLFKAFAMNATKDKSRGSGS
ncbi:MAG: hypothetical protein OEZ68_17655 [Gammaproteobacteria bacterium]|nr:hypothetical protein [Gammaproteobacteria bacterium]MDH5802631.1 hypothetical protein [Gammaproteobacteria bacterium]